MKNGFVVLCGPSGSGKSTLIQKILETKSDKLDRIVSYTTRKKRPFELHGKDYFFISEKEFMNKKNQGLLIEWSKIYGAYYGSSKEQAENCWRRGLSVIKDLDLNGLKSIQKIYPKSLSIGILVSSGDELKKRILKRGGGESLSTRLKACLLEMKDLQQFCQVKIYNDHIDQAVLELKKEIEKYLD